MCDETTSSTIEAAINVASPSAAADHPRSSRAETAEDLDEDDVSPEDRFLDGPIELVHFDWKRLTAYHSSVIMAFHDVTPILQGGNAQCGFVATAMAASAIGLRLDVQDMFSWAYEQALTNIGDLFDIGNLKVLCDRYIGVPSQVMAFPAKEAMIADLLRGKVFLVPYDASYESGFPALFNGYKAHWALVFGVVLLRDPCTPCLNGLERLSPDRPIFRGDVHFYESHMDNGYEFVLAQHGWFRDPDMWTVEELCESCCQLNEVDPKGAPEYVLPPGGIREGLRGKVLRLDL